MGKKKKYRLYNFFLKKIFYCFTELKLHTFKFLVFLYITKIITFINNIMIMDIIFQYKRNFFALHSFIYFLNPFFYFETLNNLFIPDYSNSSHNNKNNTFTLMDKSKYEKDQISLLFNKYFNIEVHEPGYFRSYYFFRILFLFIIIFCFFINMIYYYNNSLFKLVRNISCVIIYLVFQPFMQILLILYNRPFLIQLSDVRKDLNETNIFDLIILFCFNIIGFLYYDFFIYSFAFNHIDYFLHNNYYYLEWILMEISSILLIIRYKNRFSIFFQLLWSFLFCKIFVIKSQLYIYDVKKNKSTKFFFCLDLLNFSFFIIRFISLFFINKLGELLVFKIFEIIEIIFLTIFLTYLFNSITKITTISSFIKNLDQKKTICFLQIKQYFNPINSFFFETPLNSKIKEKSKEKLLKDYEFEVKNFYCISSEDYNIICNGNEKLKRALNFETVFKRKISVSFSSNTTVNDFTNFIYIFNLLYNILDSIKIRTKNVNDEFCIYNRENIFFYKVLLHFIKDEKTFRSRFIISKFLFNEKNTVSFQLNAIINFISVYLENFEKKSDNSSLMYILIFEKINSNYYKILDAFYDILKGFNNTSKKEIIYNLDKQSDIIGKSRNNISTILKKYNDFLKNFQSEKEKYSLIEDLIFNHNLNKNFDFYDFNYLDSLIEKNNFFILTIENHNFIIKKIPLLYEIKTHNIGINYYGKNFTIIFPKLISKDLFKSIKKNILLSPSYKTDSIIETSKNLILGIKLSFIRLPTMDGKIFLSCSLKEKEPTEENNYLILDSNGFIYRFGSFFKQYFGFSNLGKIPNLFKLLDIKNIEFEKGKVETIKISVNKMLLRVKQYLRKYIDSKHEEKIEVIKKLEFALNNQNEIDIIIKIENSYMTEKNELFLALVIFPYFKEGIEDKKKFAGENEQVTKLHPISFSTSASSIISFKEMKENGDKWNILKKKENNLNKKVDIFQKISFLYNLFLIILAIFLCVYIKINSNNFYQKRLNYESIRELNTEVLSLSFFILNVVKIYNSTNYNSLDLEYRSKISGFENFSLTQYVESLFKISSNYSFILYRKFKNIYAGLNHKNFFYKNISPKSYLFYNEMGQIENYSYINSFEVQLNNYYIISKAETFYINYNLINFNDTDDNDSDDEIKLKTLIKNANIYVDIFEEVNYFDKQNFLQYFKEFKIFIFTAFIIFFFFNLLSMVFLYISIKISINEIWKLVNNIMKITIKDKKFLENKINLTKKLLLNEMKASSILKILKKKTNTSKKKDDEEYSIDSEDTYLITQNATNKKIKYHFRVENKVLKLLIGLGLIFGIYIIISFPIIINYLKKINEKRKTSESLDDLLDNILKYYITIRCSILMNISYSDILYNKFLKISDQIYKNLSTLRNFIYKDSNQSALEYTELINFNNGCEILAEDENYSEYLKKICIYEPLLLTEFGNILSGYINQLRNQINAFFDSDKSYEYITKIFHSRTFQFYNIVIFIYFKNLLNQIQYSYTFPSFEKVILKLSDFLITMFIIMVATEVLNYILTAIFILGKLTSSVKNFETMNIFFLNEEKLKQ